MNTDKQMPAPVAHKKRSKNFINKDELYNEMVAWRDSNPDPDNRIPSETLGRMLNDIAIHYMTHPNYIRYPASMKEDMASCCTIAMLKALKHYDFSKNNPFAYLTQVCWSCTMTYLAKHYKYVNFKRELMKQNISDQIASGINVSSGERYLNLLNDISSNSATNEAIQEDNVKFLKKLLGPDAIPSRPSQDDEDTDEDFDYGEK